MRRRMLQLAGLLVLLPMLAACSGGEDALERGVSERAGILSGFTTTDLNGNPVDQTIFEDYSLTMINVWATFCGPCLREMPDLGELSAEYESKGVQFVGLVSDAVDANGSLDPEKVDLARQAVEETGASYLHLLPSEDLTSLLSQIYAVPTTFFVDAAGRQVGGTYTGSMSKDEWISVIDAVLAEISA